MPIRSKAEMDARRAAARAAAEPVSVPAPPPPLPSNPFPSARPRTNEPPPRGGRSTGKAGEKRSATGDHAVGYCRPPVETRFKKGGRPGPGRPKGSVSHDTVLRRQLDQKQRVRINGRERNLSLRELVVTKAVMAAVEGKDRDARKYILAEIARLYADGNDDLRTATADVPMNESDALSIAEFIGDLRDQIRADVKRELSDGVEDAK